jgi:hypothetical protein
MTKKVVTNRRRLWPANVCVARRRVRYPMYGGRMCRSQEGLWAVWQASRCEEFEGFQHGRFFPEELFHVGRRGRNTVW